MSGSSAVKSVFLKRHKKLHKVHNYLLDACHMSEPCWVLGMEMWTGSVAALEINMWVNRPQDGATKAVTEGKLGDMRSNRALEGFTEEETILERSFTGCKAHQRHKVCTLVLLFKYRWKQRFVFRKVCSSLTHGFSSSHVWMWELDYKESWAPKNWCFLNSGIGEDFCKSLGLQGDPTSPS